MLTREDAQMSVPSVGLIVLTWNSLRDTIECLRSVAALTYGNLFTVLVDNGSTDGTVMAVRAQYRDVHVIETGSNFGYTGGNNVGIEYVLGRGAKYVFILNNDATVAPGVLTSLVDYAEANPCTGMIGPTVYMYSAPERIWFRGASIDRSGQLVHHAFGEVDQGQVAEVQKSVYIPGCSLLVRTSLISEVGVLHDPFFYLFEEVDWCLRAERAGYSSVVVTSGRVWHKEAQAYGGKTAPAYLYYFARNHLLLVKRNFRGIHRYRLYYESMCRSYLRGLSFRSNSSARWAIWSGMFHFWLGRFGKTRRNFGTRE